MQKASGARPAFSSEPAAKDARGSLTFPLSASVFRFKLEKDKDVKTHECGRRKPCYASQLEVPAPRRAEALSLNFFFCPFASSGQSPRADDFLQQECQQTQICCDKTVMHVACLVTYQ